MLQDRKGFLWLGTANGVSRFDGYDFENYDIRDGLPALEILRLYEDSRDRIWFLSFSGVLSYFRNDTIYNSDLDPVLEKINPNSFFTTAFEDNQGNIWFGTERDGVYVMTGDSVTHYPLLVSKADPINPVQKFWEYDEKLFIAFTKSLTAPKIPGAVNLNLKNMDVTRGQRVIIQDTNGYVHIPGQFGEIYTWKGQTYEKTLEPDIERPYKILLSIHLDENRMMWAGFMGQGLHVFPSSTEKPGTWESKANLSFLDGMSVSDILQDREGNLWFSTLNNGIFFLNARQPVSYIKRKGQKEVGFRDMARYGKDTFLVAATGDGLKILTPDGLEDFVFSGEAGFRDIFSSGTDIWAGTETGKVLRIPFGLKNYPYHTQTEPNIYIYGKSVKEFPFETYFFNAFKKMSPNSPESPKSIYLATGWGTWKILIGNEAGIRIDKGRGLSIFVDHAGTPWISTLDGVNKIVNDSLNLVFPDTGLFHFPVSEIKDLGQDHLCFATQGNGLLIWNRKHNSIRQIKNELISPAINNLNTMGDSIIWICTPNGLNKLTFPDGPEGDLNISTWTALDGLASNQVNGVFPNGDTLFVLTGTGITLLNINEAAAPIFPPPQVHITYFKSEGKRLPLQKTYSLGTKDQNLEIGFTGISFHSARRLQYQYKVEGLDTAWTSTNRRNLTFSYLPPGDYRFRVKAFDKDGMPSKQEAILNFSIPTAWYNTWLFRLSLIISIAGILYLFFFLRYQVRKREILLTKRHLESEQKAFRAQMNPHFIFNTLNSIQHYIQSNDKLSATDYLRKFAALIRSILENSNTNGISLDEEIKVLDLYIQLEAQRLEKAFQYEIIEEVQDHPAELMLPTMILQPYIENAILHGLRPLKENGKLTIRFVQQGDSLECYIRDNGVGRKAAQDLNLKRGVTKKSMGMKVTEERLKVLSKTYQSRFVVQVTDLSHPDGSPAGTEVKLIIPLDWDI